MKKRAGYHPSQNKGSGEKGDQKTVLAQRLRGAPSDGRTLKELGFYHTGAWRRTRRMVLQRDHYLCQKCLSKNRITKATEVHHIRELEDFPLLALDLSNLVSLCWDCHEETKSHGTDRVQAPSRVRVIKITDGGAGDG